MSCFNAAGALAVIVNRVRVILTFPSIGTDFHLRA